MLCLSQIVFNWLEHLNEYAANFILIHFNLQCYYFAPSGKYYFFACLSFALLTRKPQKNNTCLKMNSSGLIEYCFFLEKNGILLNVRFDEKYYGI